MNTEAEDAEEGSDNFCRDGSEPAWRIKGSYRRSTLGLSQRQLFRKEIGFTFRFGGISGRHRFF